MLKVKLRLKTYSVKYHITGGREVARPASHPELYDFNSGYTIPDGGYTVKQDDREWMCSIINGRVRGLESVDFTRPMYII